MFDITKLIHRIPNAVSEDICKRYIDYFEEHKQKSYYESSTEANKLEPEESSFLAYEIPPKTKHFEVIREITHKAIKSYANYLDSSGNFHKGFRNVLRYSHKFRILKYEEKAKIHAHVDHMPFTYASIVINLNEGYTGGEFSFFNQKYDVNLKRGEILFFPADYFWVHEVKPITKGNRYSINSFLGSLPYNIKTDITKEAFDQENEYRQTTDPDTMLGPYDLVNN